MLIVYSLTTFFKTHFTAYHEGPVLIVSSGITFDRLSLFYARRGEQEMLRRLSGAAFQTSTTAIQSCTPEIQQCTSNFQTIPRRLGSSEKARRR